MQVVVFEAKQINRQAEVLVAGRIDRQAEVFEAGRIDRQAEVPVAMQIDRRPVADQSLSDSITVNYQYHWFRSEVVGLALEGAVMTRFFINQFTREWYLEVQKYPWAYQALSIAVEVARQSLADQASLTEVVVQLMVAYYQLLIRLALIKEALLIEVELP